jgi:hypothetical protein
MSVKPAAAQTDWAAIGDSARANHFLFYFRDSTFECISDDWRFEPDPANALFHFLGVTQVGRQKISALGPSRHCRTRFNVLRKV